MNTIRGSFWAKALAFLLLTVFGATFLVSCIGIDYMGNTRELKRVNSYFETSDCRDTLSDAANIIYSWKADGMSDEDIKFNWDYEQQWDFGDVYYEIYDSAGKLISTGFDVPKQGDIGHVHTLAGEDITVKTYVPQSLGLGLSGVNLQNAAFNFMKAYGEYLYAAALISGVMALASGVFLLLSAGHRKGTEAIVLGVIDKVPLDVLAVLAVAALSISVAFGVEMRHFMQNSALIPLALLDIAAGYLVLFAAVMTLVTRLKYGKFWENTLSWRVLLWAFKKSKIILEKLSLRLFGAKHGFSELMQKLPLIWKVALVSAVAGLAEFFLFMVALLSWDFSFFLFLLFVLFNGAMLFAVWRLTLDMLKLKNAGERLASGSLDERVDTEKMLWDFKSHGDNLNSIAQGMSRAVELRLKSERLKTELITNVSHDIKTPLTSIVSYVDLLKKEAPEGKAAEYIEILDRQSARLKKLTEDLIEASKASTGNISANLVRTDACEIARQAVGEYSERLSANGLTLLSSIPENAVYILADGRLLWRVMDNLLSNVCKYSQPNTRVYLAVRGAEGKVGISVKNISRDALNMDADELTERFVRGDTSRNTEGSGLGLNIARSLTELQNADFNLTVDGDLFKAELIFHVIE